MQWKWYFAKRSKSGYAVRKGPRPAQELIYMHKQVAKRKGLHGEIDHRNKIKLDNRRPNLRPATDTQNKGNCELRSTNKSGYRGVYWYAQTGRWCSQIKVNYKHKHLGFFPPTRAGKTAAARAYNKAARKHFGKFAYLNKV